TRLLLPEPFRVTAGRPLLPEHVPVQRVFPAETPDGDTTEVSGQRLKPRFEGGGVTHGDRLPGEPAHVQVDQEFPAIGVAFRLKVEAADHAFRGFPVRGRRGRPAALPAVPVEGHADEYLLRFGFTQCVTDDFADPADRGDRTGRFSAV